ncbi:SPRY domain-containing protein 7-like [Hetaerina americana]|uniref:SPRY domain-containing protein 7-like n=1 Tax=Hetaerina americana TaxID=62018 RepID=UPI003A7F257F
MFCCIRNCFDGLGFTSTSVPRKEINPILLDNTHMGHEVVIVKNGHRICGTGGALASAPLVQSKSYFEVKVQQSGIWGVGIATENADLNSAPGGNDQESWVLCSDSTMRHGKEELQKIAETIQEGDVLGISYDHIELNFFLNGKPINNPITGIRGTVYPALYVDDGAILDIVLDNFHHPMPMGFEKIMIEQSLL